VLEIREPGGVTERLKPRLNRVRTDSWRVGIARAPISEFTAIGRRIEVEWLSAPRGRFVADPFPLDAEHFVAEEYPSWSGVGRLAVFDVRTGRRRASFALEPDPAVHVSYPAVLRSGDVQYVLPEQSASGRLDLYRVDGTRGCRTATLLEGVAAADATVELWNGHWYLFVCRADCDPLGEQLLIFHSDRLESGWEPHPASPITDRPGRLRPAGPMFRIDERLFRPSQDCTIAYGGGIVLNEVRRLDRESYVEEPICEVRSVVGPFDDGCHTLVALDESTTLVDGNRRVLRVDHRVVRRLGSWAAGVPWVRRRRET
jgi:hypothetical protein